ncbi:MAG: hypothetical protein HYV45_03480 [Candidatus Moranbacteria bacterium]|nr:hypothetical protein [Candidatus Moranbacteria bacterium]
MHSFFASFSFLFVFGIFLFLPGFFVLRLFFKRHLFSRLERLLFSFAVSVGLFDFLALFMEAINVRLHTTSLFLGGIAVLFFLYGIKKLYQYLPFFEKNTSDEIVETTTHFSQSQKWLFMILLGMTVLIKIVYMGDAVLPTATDLGHHMYWAKLITETKRLPLYTKQEIITESDHSYTLSDPQPIADFIVGEHIPFALLHIFSGADFFSAFPATTLLFVNILCLLALVALSARFASEIQPLFPDTKIFTQEYVALATLFFFGPLYTLASPQMKFVSGGVVGNTFGNLFLPLILLCFYRAFQKQHSGFLSLGFFLTLTLAYTHHLSMLILLFVGFGVIATYLFFHARTILPIVRAWLKIFLKPAPLFTFVFATLFFFLVAMPTYIETQAVGTALGTPTKTTRTGLSFYQITFSSGEARVALGLVGLVLVAFIKRLRRSYAGAFLFGWSAILLVMTLKPGLLFINIPSNRIGTYLSFPLGLVAAGTLVGLIALLFARPSTLRLPQAVTLVIIFSLLIFSLGSGSFDNSQTLLPQSKALPALETFAATKYLSKHLSPNDLVLKDHNYIVADAWMKLFFLRDYAYPLSRGFFKRYEDNPHREQCTLLMIAVPNTTRGEKCFSDLGVDYVVVNPHFDTAQFEKSSKFSRVYANDTVHIYKKK